MDPREPQSTEPASSSHVMPPMPWAVAGTPRQDTILSAPRPAESGFRSGDASHGSHGSQRGTPSAENGGLGLDDRVLPEFSPLQARLFPGQSIAPLADDVTGIQIGHFVLDRRIGMGGMGTVFLAKDERLQRDVALKILSPQQTSEPAAVQRFLNEARAAARLDHEHIARVYYYGDEQNLHYIAFEYVQGQNLRDLIRQKGRIEPADVVNYAVQLAAALCHTSLCGVVHRDIKPSNIIVTPSGKAKLVDLGLARKESLEESAHLTVAGTTLGTFDYISPEQAKDPRNVDVRSDIYSLGCTLYHLVTGEPPYPEGTVLQRLLDHQIKEPPDPALKNRRVPPSLSAIIRKMMQGDFRRRYQSAEDLLRDLLLLGGAMGLRTVSSDSAIMTALRASPRPGWRQNTGWIAAALCLFAVVWALQAYPDLLTNTEGSNRSEVGRSASPNPLPSGLPTSRSIVASDQNSNRVSGPDRVTPVPLEVDGGPRSVDSSPTEPVDAVSQSEPSSSRAGPRMGPEVFGPVAPLSPVGEPLLSDTLPPALSGLNGTGLNGTGSSTFGPNSLSLNGTGTNRPNEVSEKSADGTRATTAGGDVRRPGNSTSEARPFPADAPVSSGASGNSATGSTSVAVVNPRPAGNTASAPVPAKTENVDFPFLLVETGQSYATLEAACAEARDSAVIELNYDGRRKLAERPMRLVNKRLTIQAAKGRSPVITFAPREHTSDASLSRLILVSGGSLTLIHVGIDVRLPEHSGAEQWMLFALERPERVRLRDVAIRLSNPRQHNAKLFSFIRPTTEAFSRMQSSSEGGPVAPPELIIERSQLVGQGVCLACVDSRGAFVECSQSLIGVSEAVFRVANSALMEAVPASAKIEITLDRCTMATGTNLLVADAEGEVVTRLLPIEFRSRNSVFACGPEQALIEQNLSVELADPRKGMLWIGERNYFDRVKWFWDINTPQATVTSMQNWGFDDWRMHWGGGELSGSHNESITWQGGWQTKNWHDLVPDDFRLNREAPNNRAVGGAADGSDAGAPLADLPRLPSP
jgi:eukaryotic-like serine/threonine-protein kinase